jgi:hypothetical protein
LSGGPGSIPGCREPKQSVVDSPERKVDQAARLVIFQSQVQNTRALKSSIKHARRSINEALRRNNQPVAQTFTKVYALLFCAWAEANFIKVIHTPHGFDLDEIDQIQTAKANGIGAAWKKCIDLALRHLPTQRGSFTPNARLKLETAIDAHVFDPSVLRNKLAHGQWVTALNRENTALHLQLTQQIQGLDIVKVSAWERGHELLADLVEHLIESPQKTFVRDWYVEVTQLEQEMAEAETRNIAAHVVALKDKDRRTGARKKPSVS